MAEHVDNDFRANLIKQTMGAQQTEQPAINEDVGVPQPTKDMNDLLVQCLENAIAEDKKDADVLESIRKQAIKKKDVDKVGDLMKRFI